MYGPEPRGHWSAELGQNCGPNHDILVAGRRYEVISEFKDFDGDIHPVGETWEFLGYCFLPYDSGMSFFVTTDPQYEWHIRLQWMPQEQGPILDDLKRFIKPAVSVR
jgi:hypothetical protein